MTLKLDKFTSAYVECALWSSTGEPTGECSKCGKLETVLYWNTETREHELCSECSGDMAQLSPHEPPLDDNYGVKDIAPATLAKMVSDCTAFQESESELLAQAGSEEQNGHDFWLTRNGHGAGYWARSYKMSVSLPLTKAAHTYGSYDLYVGDDGKVCGQ